MPLLVVLELIWVLESVYGIARAEILDSKKEFLLMPILRFEHKPVLQRFTLSAQANRFDLADLLIAHTAKNYGCETVLTSTKRYRSSNSLSLQNDKNTTAEKAGPKLGFLNVWITSSIQCFWFGEILTSYKILKLLSSTNLGKILRNIRIKGMNAFHQFIRAFTFHKLIRIPPS